MAPRRLLTGTKKSRAKKSSATCEGERAAIILRWDRTRWTGLPRATTRTLIPWRRLRPRGTRLGRIARTTSPRSMRQDKRQVFSIHRRNGPCTATRLRRAAVVMSTGPGVRSRPRAGRIDRLGVCCDCDLLRGWMFQASAVLQALICVIPLAYFFCFSLSFP